MKSPGNITTQLPFFSSFDSTLVKKKEEITNFHHFDVVDYIFLNTRTCTHCATGPIQVQVAAKFTALQAEDLAVANVSCS